MVGHPFDPLRTTLEEFTEVLGGTLRWDPPGSEHPSVSVEWFQKNILRSVTIRTSGTPETYSLTAYASTIKRNEKLSRTKSMTGIAMDRPFLDILCEGKVLAESFMEKTFLPETTGEREK